MAIKINDLPAHRGLDRKAMSAIRGAGAAWVFGWISPYVPASSKPDPVVNFYQINNNYFADQMNNQFQVVDIKNTAPGSSISLTLDQLGNNFKQQA